MYQPYIGSRFQRTQSRTMASLKWERTGWFAALLALLLGGCSPDTPPMSPAEQVAAIKVCTDAGLSYDWEDAWGNYHNTSPVIHIWCVPKGAK